MVIVITSALKYAYIPLKSFNYFFNWYDSFVYVVLSVFILRSFIVLSKDDIKKYLIEKYPFSDGFNIAIEYIIKRTGVINLFLLILPLIVNAIILHTLIKFDYIAFEFKGNPNFQYCQPITVNFSTTSDMQSFRADKKYSIKAPHRTNKNKIKVRFFKTPSIDNFQIEPKFKNSEYEFKLGYIREELNTDMTFWIQEVTVK